MNNMQCPKCGTMNQESVQSCIRCEASLTADTAPMSNPQTENAGVFIVSKRNRIIAMIWLGGPAVLITFVLLLWALINFFVPPGDNSTFLNIVNWVLGLLGLVATLGGIVGIPIAIIYITKKVRDSEHSFDPRSGNGSQSDFPKELRGWNWGAAGLTMFWGVYHSVWFSLLSLVPYLNYIWWVVMGIKGNEWAWAAQKWQSVEEFRRVQKKWNVLGIIFFFLTILLGALMLFFVISVVTPPSD